MASTLIDGEQTWAIWAVLLAAATIGFWADRTRWGARVSGCVVTIGVTFVMSNVAVLPVASPVYDVVWGAVVPLAIPLLLFRANLRRIVREGGRTLLAFACGAVGTVVGTFVAFYAIDLGPESYKLAGIFAATYVGGSMNYAATAKALDLESGDLLTAGIAADNLVMTLYFLLLFALPSIAWLRARYPDRQAAANSDSTRTIGSAPPLELLPVSAALAVATGACALGYGIADAAGNTSLAIMVVTGLVVAMATLWPAHMGQLAAGERLGTLLMQIFFATIGASANIAVVVSVGPALFVFAALILSVHLLVLLLAGWLLRLDLAELVVASNANMGGPTTAAAMAIGRGWHSLVVPAILCGTLGYAVANFVGYGLGMFLRG